MAGPLIAVTALVLVALIALMSRRQRRRVKPDPTVGAALMVRQVRAEVDSYEGEGAQSRRT